MKKTIILFTAITSVIGTALAQKEVHYAKLYYKDTKVENPDVTITVDNAVSTEGETKMKLKITNKTNNFIIYKPEESTFVINGKESKAKEKWLIISPNESDFRIVNLKGPEYNKVKNYSFKVDGLYKVIMDKKTIAAPEFKLPPSQNDFKAGNDFSCSLKKLSKETDKTEAKFSCQYTGDKIGFVFPSKTAVKMPDGNDYASKVHSGLLSKSGPLILMKGNDDSFNLEWDRMQGGKTMDMQKVEMIIKWNDAFAEGSPEKMKSETIQLEFDETTSNAKGK
jgi:hypothetical protein